MKKIFLGIVITLFLSLTIFATCSLEGDILPPRPKSGKNQTPRTPGLYRGMIKIGNQNLADSLTYISANAVSGDDFYIVLGANYPVSPTILDYSGKTVSITLMGYNSTRILSLNTNGRMLTVNSGITLTLDENISLVGQNTNNASLIFINNKGNLIMNNGAKISGNTAYTASFITPPHGGGVYVEIGGTFTMNGGEISGNTAISSPSSQGGGVFVNGGTFIMNGGKISGNTASSSSNISLGGGVYMEGGTFTMNGGEISGNTAASSSFSQGGGVFVNGGTFIMNGGKISGNIVTSLSSYGGGVSANSTFIMNGGEISGNTASSYSNTPTSLGGTSLGGGVYVDYATFTKIGGGIITGYASDTVNGNVVKNSSGVVQSNRGHAVYVDSTKRRESTAGPGVNMDSSKSGTAGGWEN